MHGLEAKTRQRRELVGVQLGDLVSAANALVHVREARQGQRGVEFGHASVHSQPFRVVGTGVAIVAHPAEGFRQRGVIGGDQAAFSGDQQFGR